MNRWDILEPGLRGKYVSGRLSKRQVRLPSGPVPLRFASDRPPGGNAPQPSGLQRFWLWLQSFLGTSEPVKTLPAPKPVSSLDRYTKLIENLIMSQKTAAGWIHQLQKEPSLPTYKDDKLVGKLAKFILSHESARNTVGEGDAPKLEDQYRVAFNELESSQPEIQVRGLRFFIREFMQHPLEGLYAEYFQQRNPKHYHVIPMAAGEHYLAFKGAFVDPPIYFMDKMRELESAKPGLEFAFMRKLAFDDPFQVLSVAIHEHALEVAKNKAFPDYLEDELGEETDRLKALKVALDSIYHPTPAMRLTGLNFFTQLILEDRNQWIEKSLDHYENG